MLGFIAFEVREGSGEDERLSRERSVAGTRRWSRSFPTNTEFPKPCHFGTVALVCEEACDTLSNHGAHAIDARQGLSLGLHQGIEIAEVRSQQFCHGRTHVTDSERDEEAGKCGVSGFLEAGGQIVGGLLSHALEA